MSEVKVSAFRLDPKDKDFEELKKTYKLTTVGDGKPELRFYPNEKRGSSKHTNSYAIAFDKENKDFQPIINEINKGMNHHVRAINSNEF